MASVADVEIVQPDLAERVRAILSSTTNAVLGTIRRDGSPRLSGVDPYFHDGPHGVELSAVQAGRELSAARCGPGSFEVNRFEPVDGTDGVDLRFAQPPGSDALHLELQW